MTNEIEALLEQAAHLLEIQAKSHPIDAVGDRCREWLAAWAEVAE